ncbi:MAG TPA: polyisoprenoid-binding protein [Balneolaceae bacterium]|nr:polyisoprenoid-binding protein [Balneolaceae bacterium]|tara:strand:- start:58179 stop:58787 length:609 start_codon:yes stop_codon:yes gene_type:complete
MKLSRKLALSAFAIIFGLSTVAMVAFEAMSWDIDKTHSGVNFEIRHFFSPVNGAFEEYEADIKFDPANLDESSIDATVQVASVNTKNERRDGHLQSADFFNAPEYPTMTFVSEKIEKTGDNEFVAHGTLTIKDTSTDFDLPFTLLGVQDHPMRENTKVAGITSNFQLLRNDYGVGTGDWVSDAVVGNEVDVTLNLELHSSQK